MSQQKKSILQLIFTALFLQCGTSSTGPSTVLPPETGITETVARQIGPEGGTVSLSNGARIVFPPQAVKATVTFTISSLTPGSFFQPDSTLERMVFRCTGAQDVFSVPVEIRVPLPQHFAESDSGVLFGGYLDESTGLRMMRACSIEKIDGAVWGVMKLDHFSSPFMEWISEKISYKFPPQSAGPFPVPYYAQGESAYCWAASLQMVTQYASFDMRRNIMDIIGETQIDESGVTSLAFRVNSTIANIVKSRTGSTPDRCQWDFVNYEQANLFMKREIGLRGVPVAFHFTPWNHAIVIIGYKGDIFYAHDPASTSTNSIGYREIPWSDIKSKMGLGQNMTLLSIPGKNSTPPEVTLNIMNNAVQFIKPVHPSDAFARIYRLKWDAESKKGYSFFDLRDQKSVEILPGTVTEFSPEGSIEVVNSSRSAARSISASMDIVCLAEKGFFHSQSITLTLPPNSQQNLKFNSVPFDKFRYNGDTVAEYGLTFRIFENSSLIDEQSIYFKVAPRDVVIDKALPDSAGPKTKIQVRGYGFGASARGAHVTFSGKHAQIDSASWSDTLAAVIVPENAVTGPLQITVGKMKSNTVPFTVTKTTVVQIPFTWSSINNPFADVVLEASVNVKVSGQVIDTFTSSAGSHQIYSMAPDIPSRIEVSMSATLDKYTLTKETSNKGTRVLIFKQPDLLSFRDTKYESFPVNFNGEFPLAINDKSIDFEFKHHLNRISITLQAQIYYDYEDYDSLGVLMESKTNAYYTAGTVGIVSIDWDK